MSWDEEIVVKKENSFENNANISGQESQKSFKCDRLPKPCSLTFDNIQAKNQHIKEGYGIVGNRLFTCPKPKCEFRSCFYPGAAEHLKNHDNEDRIKAENKRNEIAKRYQPRKTFKTSINLPLYKCDRCSCTFDTIKAKNQHMNMGLGYTQFFQCPQCEFRSCHINGTTEHFAQNHVLNSNIQNQEDKNQQENIQNNGTNHGRDVNVTIFKCDRCSTTFESNEAKEKHMKMDFGSQLFQCPECEFRSCHYNGAIDHLAKNHSIIPKFIPKEEENKQQFPGNNSTIIQNDGTNVTVSPIVFKCDRCSKTFENNEAKDKHMQNFNINSSQLFQCPECEFRSCHEDGALEHYTQKHDDIIQEHSKNELENIFKCNRCSNTFESNEAMEKHMKMDFGSQLFQCPKCEFRSCHYNETVEHHTQKHNDIVQKHSKNELEENISNNTTNVNTTTVFQCPKCEFRSYNYNQTVQHFTQNHATTKIQEDVNKKNQQEHGNIRIQNSTNTVKIYKCDKCGMIFETFEEITLHYTQNHAPTKAQEDVEKNQNQRENGMENQEQTIETPVAKLNQRVVDALPRVTKEPQKALKRMATIIKNSNPGDFTNAKIPRVEDVPVKMMNGKIQNIPKNRISYVYRKCKLCLLYFREESDLQTHACNPTAAASTLALYNSGNIAPNYVGLQQNKTNSNESQTSPSTQQQQPTLNMNTTAPIRKKSLENLKCDYCNRVFNSDSSRKYHINSSHYNVKNEKCDRAFGSFEELKKHNEEEHWHSNHNFFQGSSNVKNNSKVIAYKCINCQTSYFCDQHLMEKHLEECRITFDRKGLPTINENFNTHPPYGELKRCQYCGKTFGQNKYNLEKHINSDHVGQLFPLFCYFCASSFKTFDDLESHSQTAFEVGKQFYSCQLCGDPKYKPRYILLSNLLQHMDKDHKNHVKNMYTYKHGTLVVSPINTDNNVPIQENEQETNNQNNENKNKVTEIFNELNPEEEEDDTIIQCDLCPTPKIFKFDGVSRKTAESKLERHIQKFHPTESNNANSGGVYGFGKLDFQPVCRHCGAKNPTARHDCYLTIVNK